MKAKSINNTDGKTVAYEIKCLGCGHPHVYYTEPFDTQYVWKFNGDADKPTFTPSLLNTWTKPNSGEVIKVCHLFVTDGKIQYLADCTHKLAGQTIEMPEYD